MLKKILFILFSICLLGSCDKEKEEQDLAPKVVKNTTIMFFPWSNNLTSCFLKNIDDFHNLIKVNKLHDERLLVCIERSVGVVHIIEITENQDNKTIEIYENPRFTTPDGISNFLNKIYKYSPAETYSMIIGCHGTAWLPATDIQTRSFVFDDSTIPLTRYIGGTTREFQIEISVLKDGILNSMIPKFEYILFDDCYMANVEVAYELKDVCNHIVASPTEIMAYGFPYDMCGSYLLGNINYDLLCRTFFNFYSRYSIPCGTISVIDCNEIDSLASVVREIYSFSPKLDTISSHIQRMDGYAPPLFYDFGDYVNHLVISDSLKQVFSNKLEKAVPYKRNTSNYFSTFEGMIPISNYSGITTSMPSTHPSASKIVETSWYIATH